MSIDTSEFATGGGDEQNSFSGRKLAVELTAEAPAVETPDIDSLVKQDARIVEIREQIRVARTSKDVRTADRLVAENRTLTDQVRAEIEKAHGLYVDPAEVAQKDEEARLNELAGIKQGLNGEETDEELLLAFRLMDEEGKPQIDSPLFKAKTRRAFDMYIGSVRSWKAAVESESSLRNQQNANLRRTEMHDDVARAIGLDLGLEFASARRLAAKIRDARIPGSAESRLYARKVNHELEGYGFDLGQFMQHQKEDLEEILHEKSEPGHYIDR